jgi:hypothetical protein
MLGFFLSSILAQRSFRKFPVVCVPGLSTKLFSSSILDFTEKPHNSIEIEINDGTSNDSSEFAVKLWNTISTVKSAGKTSIFLSVPMIYSHHIPIAG